MHICSEQCHGPHGCPYRHQVINAENANVTGASAAAEVARATLKRASERTKQLLQPDIVRGYVSRASRLLSPGAIARNGPTGVAEAKAYVQIASERAINKDEYKQALKEIDEVEHQLKGV